MSLWINKTFGIAFVLSFLFGFIFVKFYETNLEREYLSPSHFVPLRHIVLQDNPETESVKIFEPGARFDSILSKNFNKLHFDKTLSGIVVKIGTYGKEVETGVTVEVERKNGNVSICQTKSSQVLRDNSNHRIIFNCSEPLKLSDIADISIIFTDLQANNRVTLYKNSRGDGAYLQLILSNYESDLPAKSFREAKNFGALWDEQIFSLLDSIFLNFLLPCLLAFWVLFGYSLLKNGISGKGLFKYSIPLLCFSILMGILGTLLNTPPLQYPDEPQLLSGSAKLGMNGPNHVKFRQHLRDIGTATGFGYVAQTRNVPVLEIENIKPGIPGSDKNSEMEHRSKVFSTINKHLTPIGVTLYHNLSQLNKNQAMFIKGIHMIPTFSLILIFLFLYLSIGEKIPALVLILSCANPASQSILCSFSNYSWAIAVGSCLSSLLFVDWSLKNRKLLFFLAMGMTILLADSTKLMRVSILICPLVVFIQFHLGRKNPSWYTVVTTLLCLYFTVKLVLTSYLEPFLKISVQLEGIHYFLSYLFKFIAEVELLLAMLIVRLVSKPIQVTISTATKWRMTLAYMLAGIAIFSAIVIAFNDLSYAPNIYGDSSWSLSNFLTRVVLASLSQTLHYSQDYFLWKTNFLAYGWLDTTANDLFYFSIKMMWLLLVFLAGIALIWCPRKAISEYVLPSIIYLLMWFAALVGGWVEQHTAVGRYLLPIWPLIMVPATIATARLFSGSRRSLLLHGMLIGLGAFFSLSSIYGSQIILIKRFVIGGNF